MPLHDWSITPGWNGVRLFWMVEIVRYLQQRMPPDFRVYIGTSPVVAVDEPSVRPDAVIQRRDIGSLGAPEIIEEQDRKVDPFDPDREVVLKDLEQYRSLYVEYGGRMIAAIELVSPNNKCDALRRTQATTRYLGYLTNGVNLLVIDPHPDMYASSLTEMVVDRLGLPDEPLIPAPHTIGYRVGVPSVSGGRYLAVRRRPLIAGPTLPKMPIALNEHLAVMIDLESTYMRAAADAYLA